MNTVERVTRLIEPLAEQNDLNIFDIEYVKEGKNWFLRIYITKDEGVDLTDCADFSEVVSEALDQADPDPIPFAYFLEVSSPGAERPLKTSEQFEQAEGEYIFVSLYQAHEGRNTYEGTLKRVTEDEAVIEYREKTRHLEVTLPRELISKARLAIEF